MKYIYIIYIYSNNASNEAIIVIQNSCISQHKARDDFSYVEGPFLKYFWSTSVQAGDEVDCSIHDVVNLLITP